MHYHSHTVESYPAQPVSQPAGVYYNVTQLNYDARMASSSSSHSFQSPDRTGHEVTDTHSHSLTLQSTVEVSKYKIGYDTTRKFYVRSKKTDGTKPKFDLIDLI